MGNEEKSQATAELPKLPLPFTDAFPVGWAYDQPCDDPMPDLYSEYQMNAYYLAGYEAGRASRAQSEPEATMSWNGFNLQGDLKSINEARRMLHSQDRLTWFEDEYKRRSATLGETK